MNNVTDNKGRNLLKDLNDVQKIISSVESTEVVKAYKKLQETEKYIRMDLQTKEESKKKSTESLMKLQVAIEIAEEFITGSIDPSATSIYTRFSRLENDIQKKAPKAWHKIKQLFDDYKLSQCLFIQCGGTYQDL